MVKYQFSYENVITKLSGVTMIDVKFATPLVGLTYYTKHTYMLKPKIPQYLALLSNDYNIEKLNFIIPYNNYNKKLEISVRITRSYLFRKIAYLQKGKFRFKEFHHRKNFSKLQND